MPAQVIDTTNLTPSQGYLILGATDSNAAGRSVTNLGDINGDGIDDFAIGAARAGSSNPLSGATYVIFGKAGATRPTIDLEALSPSDGFVIVGSDLGDSAGFAIAGAGDINGDGLDDLVIGAYKGENNGGVDTGEVYVIFGQAGATRGNINLGTLAAIDGFRITGDADYDFFGRSVAGGADVNGDGFDDILVGAWGGDGGGPNAGEAYVIFGAAGATRDNIDITDLTAEQGYLIQGDQPVDEAGRRVALGDVNGDGAADVIIGAPRVDTSGGSNDGTDAGAAYVSYRIQGIGAVDLGTLDTGDGFVVRGDAAGDRAGYSVAFAGDINGDGVGDLIVGADSGDDGGFNAGEAYVIYGRNGGDRDDIDLTNLTPQFGFKIVGDAAGDLLARSVSAAGDINGDGIGDLIVGSGDNDVGGNAAGAAYVIFGRVGQTRGAIDLSTLADTDGVIIRGDVAFDTLGLAVSAAGDVNADGIDDLLMGAPNGKLGGHNAGQVYVIFGSRDFGAMQGTGDSDTLQGSDGPDTLRGNGGDDVLDGRLGSDRLVGGVGSDVYVIDDAGDQAIEAAGEGIDRVETVLAAYTLAADVENMEYTGDGSFAGTGNGLANHMVGGLQGDSLSGNDGDDTLGGEAGNDTLNGGNGSDRLFGGTGADTMNGEAGNDRIVVDDAGDIANGGDGVDTVQIVTAGLSYVIAGDVEIISNHSGGDLTVTLNGLANTYGGSAGVDTVNASDGQDTVYGRSGNDVLRGEAGTDYLFGESGNDRLEGGDGVDFLYGAEDDDVLLGGSGNDTLYGGDGSDDLTGGAGLDMLIGGNGADDFIFADGDVGSSRATADRILDWSRAQGDRIDLSGIDAIAGGADDAFSFIGVAAFSGVAGQLRYASFDSSNTSTVIEGDTDGDGIADFVIRVDGNFNFNAGDFLL